MTKVSGPFQGYFKPDATREDEPDMVAHNLPEMMEHVARATSGSDARFRGYVKVLNHAGLRVAEVNILGTVERVMFSEADRRAMRNEAEMRRGDR